MSGERRLVPSGRDAFVDMRAEQPVFTACVEKLLSRELGLTPKAEEYAAVAYHISEVSDRRDPYAAIALGLMSFLEAAGYNNHVTVQPNEQRTHCNLYGVPENVAYRVYEVGPTTDSNGMLTIARCIVLPGKHGAGLNPVRADAISIPVESTLPSGFEAHTIATGDMYHAGLN